MLRQRTRWSVRAFALTGLFIILVTESHAQSKRDGVPVLRTPLPLRDPVPSPSQPKDDELEEPPRLNLPAETLGKASKSPSLFLSPADGSNEKAVTQVVDEAPLGVKKRFVSSNEKQIVIPMIWQLGSAAQSHLSPYFFQVASQQPLQVINDEPTKVEQPTSQTFTAIAEATKSQTSLVEEEDPGLPEVDESLVEDVSEQSSTTPQTIESPASRGIANVGNKRPKAIRIPFDESTEDVKDATSLPRIADSASKKDTSRDESKQEAPLIDQRSSNGKEDQGVDALNATKPGQFKREILIDDPQKVGKMVPSAVPSFPLDPAQTKRLSRCDECLKFYLTHPESTSVRSPWAVMHALLAFGSDYELQHGSNRVNAIGWMCHNGTCRTQRIFTPTSKGFIPNVGGGVQGHEGQFLAILAQTNVPLDYPIQIGTKKFKVEDLVRYEMATCKEKSELTFKLIGLSYYLDSNKQWRTNDGKVWSIPKLIQEELAQPVVGAACGGTHRLMGLSFSVRQRVMQGQSISGQYARADKFVRDYVEYTWQLQNPDGSFSTEWYEGRGNEPNDERKVQTTGHMLEWLMYTLPDAELNQPRVQKSIDFLLSHIYDRKENKWPIGPRGHATRAISLYFSRYHEIRSYDPGLLQPRSRSATRTTPSKAPFRK